MNRSASPPAQPRLAAGYFLGFVFLALAVALWLRGLGRLLLPLLLVGGVAYVVVRVVRAIRAPLP
ncbi:MAG: hypothetical protein FJ265_19180 [Planctomycetes bacterium]|nr:hypothetical protein [Planctomycetota bacterium]